MFCVICDYTNINCKYLKTITHIGLSLLLNYFKLKLNVIITGLPVEVGGAVPVLPEELRMILYQPAPEEWPRGDCDATCRRIIQGLDQVN